MSEALAIIRLRGTVGVNYDIEHTLKLLKLNKANHAVVYPSTPQIQGMLKRVKDHVTYGEVSVESVEHLLRKRGELQGRVKLTDEFVKENTSFKNISDLAKALAEGKLKLADIPNFRPVFRLSPPRKGFKSLKNPVGRKGDLGYRGEKIDELLSRMT